MTSEHLEWPALVMVFLLGQSVAAVNYFELINQGIAGVVGILTIGWLGVQIWSKIKLTNKELEDDE